MDKINLTDEKHIERIIVKLWRGENVILNIKFTEYKT